MEYKYMIKWHCLDPPSGLADRVCCRGRGPPVTSCWLQPGHQSGGRIEGAGLGDRDERTSGSTDSQ